MTADCGRLIFTHFCFVGFNAGGAELKRQAGMAAETAAGGH